jgi:hypothetical protein
VAERPEGDMLALIESYIDVVIEMEEDIVNACGLLTDENSSATKPTARFLRVRTCVTSDGLVHA